MTHLERLTEWLAKAANHGAQQLEKARANAGPWAQKLASAVETLRTAASPAERPAQADEVSTQLAGQELTEVASQTVEWIARTEYSQARSLFDDAMLKAMPEKALDRLWNQIIAKQGAFQATTKTLQKERDGYQAVYVNCQFEHGPLAVRLVFDANRCIAGMQVGPPIPDDSSDEGTTKDQAPKWHRPQTPKGPFPYPQHEVSYENPTDQSTIGGTLTIPEGPGPHPAVLLITGSGSQDRDETIFGHKPFSYSPIT